MIIDYDHSPSLNEDEKLRSLAESVQRALNAIDGGQLTGEIDGNRVNIINVNGSNLQGVIDGDYLFVKNLDADSIKAVEAWVDKLLVQTHLLANEGEVFELDAIEVNASKIKTGTLDVERIIITQRDQQGHEQKYLVHWNTDGTYTTEKLDGNVIEDLTITADKIVSGSIMTRHITTQNIEGTSGWINLREGKFFYGNGTNITNATKGISWNGSNLNLKVDSLLISGSTAATQSYADDAAEDAYDDAVATAAGDATNKANEAKKVATNYLSYTPSGGVDVGYSGLNSKVNIRGDGVRLYNEDGYEGAYLASKGLEVYDGTSAKERIAHFGNGAALGYGGSDYFRIAPTGEEMPALVKVGEYTSSSPTTSGGTSSVKVILSNNSTFSSWWASVSQGDNFFVEADITIYRTFDSTRLNYIHNLACDFIKGASDSASHTQSMFGTASLAYSTDSGGTITASFTKDSGTSETFVSATISVYKYIDMPAPAIALGSSLIPGRSGGLVCGSFNTANFVDSYAFVVGNGYNGSNRSDAFTVDWQGNVANYGHMDVGGELIAGSVKSTTSVYGKCSNDGTGGIAAALGLQEVQLSQSVTVDGNSAKQITVSFASYVSGYNWCILYANNQNTRLIAGNYWRNGTSVEVIYRNVASSSQTGTAQVSILRWKE